MSFGALLPQHILNALRILAFLPPCHPLFSWNKPFPSLRQGREEGSYIIEVKMRVTTTAAAAEVAISGTLRCATLLGTPSRQLQTTPPSPTVQMRTLILGARTPLPKHITLPEAEMSYVPVQAVRWKRLEQRPWTLFSAYQTERQG